MIADEYTMFRAACLFEKSSVRSHARRLQVEGRDIRRTLRSKDDTPMRRELIQHSRNILARVGLGVKPVHSTNDDDALRVEVMTFMERVQMSQAKFITGVRCSKATLSRWLKGIYKGDNAKVSAKVRQALLLQQNKIALQEEIRAAS